MKTIHFVSGLPFSCSTLLVNLLSQNPKVHGTQSSMLHEIGYIARQVFQIEESKCFIDPQDSAKQYYDYVRGGCSHAFDSLTDRPIVIDKGRSWVGHLDQTFQVWPNAKIIVPVRDIRGILASMERRRRKNPAPMSGIEAKYKTAWPTIEGRIQAWLEEPPIGISIKRVYEASQLFRDRLHFVHAEDLCSDPVNTMQKIWNYLGENFNNHNFDNVEQYTKEIEMGWPYGEHKVRPQVLPLKPYWNDMLGRQLSETINQKFSWINQL